MEYIVYISTTFGELRVCFETEKILKDDNEVLTYTIKELEKSPVINIEELKSTGVWFEIAEGETLES